MTVRDTLLAWIDQFENDHYEFDVYGENVSVDLPREKVEKVLDISLLLCDRVVEAKDELFMADYLNVEESIRQKCKDDKHWMFYLVDEDLNIVKDRTIHLTDTQSFNYTEVHCRVHLCIVM